MTDKELKKKYMHLWKETFRDSDAYINLYFDTYFNPEYAVYSEKDGELRAALLGVPYYFGNANSRIRGLYLCGLATNAKYRSQGIMTELIEKINLKAASDGFAFTFLIPSNEGLERYYRDRGYVNAFYRVADFYSSVHDFDREYESILAEQKDQVAELKRHYYSSLQCKRIDARNPNDTEGKVKIKCLVNGLESMQKGLQLIHSDADMDALISENRLDGGEIHYALDTAGNATAAAFITLHESEIIIHRLYSSDTASKFKILQYVKECYPELAVCQYMASVEMDRSALWYRTYGSYMPEGDVKSVISSTERVYSLGAHSKIYGMARILNLPEILKFQAHSRKDLKYSILTKGKENGITKRYTTRNGEVAEAEIPTNTLTASEKLHVMPERDIAAILFRRHDTDNLLTEAFGMPSVNGAISLMMD